MSRRIGVGILGATGTIGQKLVRLLLRHPWFELRRLMASERSVGKPYGETVHWLEPEPLPPDIAAMEVEPAEPGGCAFVLSALDAEAARALEPRFAQAGCAVISNASAHRLDPDVPLVVPEVNPDHLELAGRQPWPGAIVTNPNCVVAGLVLVLKPLHDAFGVEAVQLTTLQAVSGAGYPGVPALDILGDVIPGIAGEEEKLSREPRKILGTLDDGCVAEAPIAISAQTTRVPVVDGHLLSMSVRLGRRASPEQVAAALERFRAPERVRELPSAPAAPLAVFADPLGPRPRLHAGLGAGMTVSVGRIRACPVLDVRLVALVHNTVRGAAGAALLDAELMVVAGGQWLVVRETDGR
ncbi:MAG TPA: aspartate-semialdehyde dehydrogenase [Thermoanaerobaculaceae bacterium]|nr:aspartate-semialdehyde dehydrogenase [Thermoanaerobaculaceae bacterium]HRS14936.1 aspartate-semialdehyde dehydrogenase [Thermoanaerobaculaceae bacterium]